jgi:hypothetical protein
MAIVQELEGDSFSQAQMLFVFQTFHLANSSGWCVGLPALALE